MSKNNNNQIVQDTSTNRNHIKRILYATDLTESSPKVYQYVLYLAKQFDAEIVCLHVIDTYSKHSAMTLAMYYLTKEEKQAIVNRERNKSLEEMANRNRLTFIRQQLGTEDGLCPEQLDLNIVNKVVFGNVEEQILKHSADSDCDLIIMGTHGYKGFERIIFGSVADKVVKNACCPVMTINPYQDMCEEQE